ncbi:protein kinase domain protein [Ichthyophthirius multifiliis]|uniref:Aurora kinase n=1 Tax=Ichthyophthirius multifiliis TaxID=5932 RepID=G0R6I0_ICHMU|nr:protein kinase domain protein [Ichthyophthirius multifiliis]EGR26942.1 protein kinase domain protein [Ichthyophthirius multifiliis]|eukprot:XP_004023826.1 protein kinase domain protein [Ichthyophthirius multifiliis]
MLVYKQSFSYNNFYTSINQFQYVLNNNYYKICLGKGSFGCVYLVQDKQTEQKYAIKIIDLQQPNSKQVYEYLENEIQIHNQLNHKNIIKFIDSFKEDQKIYMVLEYAFNGNLFNFLKLNKNIDQNLLFKFYYQTCLAVQYLHSLNIYHRDIKPENLLLDENLNIKLCDFGWSINNLETQRNTFCGTLEYMAPEIIFRQQYDYKVDIWSLGIFLYELYHGFSPFEGRNFNQIQQLVYKGDIYFTEGLEKCLKFLICQLLQADPVKRFNINDILNHSWIKNMIIKIKNNQQVFLLFTKLNIFYYQFQQILLIKINNSKNKLIQIIIIFRNLFNQNVKNKNSIKLFYSNKINYYINNFLDKLFHKLKTKKQFTIKQCIFFYKNKLLIQICF